MIFEMGRYTTVCIKANEILKHRTEDTEGNINFCIDLSRDGLKTIELNESFDNSFYHFIEKAYAQKLNKTLLPESLSKELPEKTDLFLLIESNIASILNRFREKGIAFHFLEVDFEGLLNSVEDYDKNPKGIALNALITNGFSISGAQNNENFCISGSPLNSNIITYKTFLTSSSKVKKQRVIFVNEIYVDELNRIFDMGLDMSKIPPINASKFNAYRGLYLSDGELFQGTNQIIDIFASEEEKFEIDNKFKLSADNVLVINDEEISEKAEYITALKKENTINEWELCEPTTGNISFDPFDGEGIISPELLYHWDAYNCRNTNQVRLPYAKGVLHTFNIHGFINELFGDERIFVKDYWGIERDLNKVQIICGSSFFKCAGWLCDGYGISTPSKDNDPLERYFHYFYEYDHRFVFCNTEDNYDNSSGMIKLNYQILNTLDMSKSEFEDFVLSNIHTKKLIVSKDTIANFPFLKKYKIDGEDLYSLIEYNDNFVKIDKVKNLYRSIIDKEIKEIAQGRIQVTGERRFLSRDLIAYMYCVLKKSNVGDSQKLKELSDKLMPNGYFFAPQMNLELEKMYAIYRSPHLSRNEQVALKAFVPDEKSIYHKYLNQCDTVCFMPLRSLDPLTLGGADMDGDTISIITDQKFINAVLRGVYNIDNGEFVRKLPIELIPSTKAENEKCPSNQIDIQALANSFNSQIGIVSNMALQVGMLEYFSEKDSSKYTNQTAFSAILAGLSIDAAKTGVNPSINCICDLIKDKSNYKKILDKKIKPFQMENPIVAQEGNYYILKNTSEQKVFVPIPDDNCSNVDLLIPIFCKICKQEKEISSIIKNNDNSIRDCLYVLKAESKEPKFKWKKKADPEIQKELKKIKNTKNKYKEFTENNKISKNAYDLIIKEFLAEKTDQDECENYLSQYKSFFRDLITSIDEAEAIWQNIINSNWKYMTKQQRIDFLSSICVFCADKESENERNKLGYYAYQLLIDFSKSGFALLMLLVKNRYLDLNNKILETKINDEINTECKNNDIYNSGLYRKMLENYKKNIQNLINSKKALAIENKKFEFYYLHKVFKSFFAGHSDSEILINLKAAGYTDGDIWDYFGLTSYKKLLVNQNDISKYTHQQ